MACWSERASWAIVSNRHFRINDFKNVDFSKMIISIWELNIWNNSVTGTAVGCEKATRLRNGIMAKTLAWFIWIPFVSWAHKLFGSKMFFAHCQHIGSRWILLLSVIQLRSLRRLSENHLNILKCNNHNHIITILTFYLIYFYSIYLTTTLTT